MNVKDICKRLIKVKSMSGEENLVVEEIKLLMKECGFHTIKTDKYGNVIGSIKGKYDGKKILFDAHIDTVPVSDISEWTYDPFSAKEHDGKIYGRGTTDMKGALSAMLYAGKVLSKTCDFSGEFLVAGVVHEECFEGIASREISRKYKPDFVVIGEATELEISLGQRGRAEIILETFGKCAHSANPEKGVNAVLSMLEICKKIDEIPLSEEVRLGKGILSLTDIKSSPYPGASVIPNHCRVTYDRRTLIGETEKDILKPIEDIIEKHQSLNNNFKASVKISKGKERCYTGEYISGERFFPAWAIENNDDFAKNAIKSAENIGLNPVIRYYSFCTNGSHYAGEAGIKTIGFGPSKESLAHVSNEYVKISDLEKASEFYVELTKTI